MFAKLVIVILLFMDVAIVTTFSSAGVQVQYWELDHAYLLCKKYKGLDYIKIKLQPPNFVTCKDGKTFNMDIKQQDL